MTKLQCLKCGGKLECVPERCVCRGCGATWPVSGGIPRFFEAPDQYWGEVGRNQALELLETARRGSWSDAVRTYFPENIDMRISLLDLQRASWAPMLGLDEQSSVLDIGSGYGAITHSLSRFAGEVYSVEAIRERIDFTQERLRQERILNVHLIQASATSLPLAENSFDLVVVNGVLEWVAEWDLTLDPRTVQINFLRKICHLLKDDGILLVGIENRFGLGSFLGRTDHSGLAYTSLVPRVVATFMMRHSSKPHHRTELNTLKQYRTYTYSERGYCRLLSDAGFGVMSPYWAYPGYNQPYALIPLAVRSWIRQHSLQLLEDPSPAPRRSWVRRLKRAAMPFSRWLVSDFLLLAAKGRGQNTKLQSWIRQRLLEANKAPSDLTVGSQSVAWSLHAHPFKEVSIVRLGDARTGTDRAYVKVFTGKATDGTQLATEVKNRAKVQEALDGSDAQCLRVPRSYGMMQIGRTTYYLEAASRGIQISTIVGRLGYFGNEQRVEKDFVQICDRIIELTSVLQKISGVRTIPPAWREIPETIRSRPDLMRALEEGRYFQKQSHASFVTWIQHGDLSVENTHFDRKTGEFEVFDWSDLAGDLPPLYDFFQFFFSTAYLPAADEAVRFASEEDRWIATFKALFLSHEAFGRAVRRFLLHACEQLNVSPTQVPSLLLEFLIIGCNYYQQRSSDVQHRVRLRLLELTIAAFDRLRLSWEQSKSISPVRSMSI